MSAIRGLVRKAAASMRRRRDPYLKTLSFLERSDRWPETRMKSWQLRELNKLLLHARRHSPGYEAKLKGMRLNGGLSRLQDLSKVPFLTKEELRSEPGIFTARNVAPDSLLSVMSGGTTGTPARFMADRSSYDRTFDAWRHAMWRRAGYAPGMPTLDLTWAFVGDDPTRVSSAGNYMYLSIHALDAGRSDSWLRDVSALQPDFIVGFPSTAAAFVNLLPESHSLRRVRALLLASEVLTLHQRRTLESRLPQARIFQWYGVSELAGFASGCEKSDIFHHWPQSGVIEIVDKDGEVLRSPGDQGEIVLTGFSNFVTPFIRYRTGDRATLGHPCALCGRPDIVLRSIEGRTGDYLLRKDGGMLPLSALNFHSDEFRHVFTYQFVQDVRGEVVLRLMTTAEFADHETIAIDRLISEKLGPEMKLKIERVSSIARTGRGKLQPIVRRCE